MNPKVSVCIFTYNHEKYIERCIESALMQNTSFDVEIVLGEDYSKDTTRKICKRYAEKYPKKIKLLDRGKNIGMCQNIFGSLQHCTGEYIATLDGDDYWIDPLKLQKQFDYLEREPDKNMVFHQSLRINELNGLIDFFVKEIKPVYSFNEVMDKWLMATGSMFFRAKAMVYPDFVFHTHNFDLAIQLLVNRNGNDIGYIDEMMSVYYINTGSNTNNPAYDLENTSRRLKVLYTEFDDFTNHAYAVKIAAKQNELDNYIKQSGRFQLKPILIQFTKSLLKKFGVKLVRTKPRLG